VTRREKPAFFQNAMQIPIPRAAKRAIAVASLVACAPHRPEAAPIGRAGGEVVRVLDLYPGVTATIVEPARIDRSRRVELILYALPNGNSTAETMGRRLVEGAGWRFDIQHIAAQTRALRAGPWRGGLEQAVVVYLEAEGRSWPAWRRSLGLARANDRIVDIVAQIRAEIGAGHPERLAVTLTGHSGGGSFMFGFLEGQAALPPWLERIAFLDANYNFEPRHGGKLAEWLRDDPRRTLVVLAYDDREIVLDGKKVVSDSGGTWRASRRMIEYLEGPFDLAADTLGEFLRYGNAQIELLLHPNPRNQILHTVMIGEMNGYMHALLTRRPAYAREPSLLRAERAYSPWVEGDVVLPAPVTPDIPTRAADAPGGSAFIAALASPSLSRDEREAAIRRELLAGNVPTHLRRSRPVTASVVGPDGIERSVTYEVMPDYLAIGSDDDWVRMPMNPYTAQAFCDAFGFVLPTRKMVNDIWAAAAVHVDPRPLTKERESPLTFLQHHRIIEEQMLAGSFTAGSFVGGHKKDVVVSNVLRERPGRVAIYGWHYVTGRAIQPLYAGHTDWYVDYSHGIRPVRRRMRVDGVETTFERILGDSVLAPLLSDEGVIAVPRYVPGAGG